MKLQRRNLLLVGVALGLGAVTLLTQKPQTESATAGTTDLFGFEEAQVKALTVQVNGRSLAFERDKNKVWQMTKPDKAVANDANVAYLVNLLATGVQSDRPLTVTSDKLGTYGLDKPYATLDVTLENGEAHKLVLGTYNFNRANLYALIDSPKELPEELKVALVSPDFEVALNRPLNDWKQP
ncbi:MULTISPECIES: DUF4340 domain-containing protein [unclassified Leptolyngbya]|uniref:DUF4340 domain-containing protein n=1 Tax=unclassified Leptolyngbya TaxID=2650499 RepID=UPI001689067D|nr:MULTISPECIES: DUF4340 domain-containing protein [unclassified Leptolyngbya]MBD1910529.1 DUF4340 domain-containing protein [Leptolyngbya sp. FACHB-8]MBD2153900.1 DUF4340 domain-containing protein [Leptolyngbya sp. FACHB-16]